MDESGPRDPRRPRPEDASLLAFLVAGAAFAGLAAILSVSYAESPEYTRAYPSRSLPPQPEQRILAPAGPDEDYFPCSDCHEDEPTNRSVRELEDEHEDLALAHGDLWCLHCHDANDRDQLHLADRSKLEFEDSWRLCVQCHGHKQDDWRAGVHGKRVGHWWGEKDVWTCVSCHRPHSPHFQPVEPEPPPKPPQNITLRHASRSREDVHE